MFKSRTRQPLKLALTAIAVTAATTAWARSAHAQQQIALEDPEEKLLKKSADDDAIRVQCDMKKIARTDLIREKLFQPFVNQLIKSDQDEVTEKKTWELEPLTVTARRSGETVFFEVGNSKNQSVTLQSLVENSLPECKSTPERKVTTHLDPNEFFKMSLPFVNSETLTENADLIKNEAADLLGQIAAIQEQARGRGIMGGAAKTSDFAGIKQRVETPMAGQAQGLGTATNDKSKDLTAKKAE